MISIDLHIRGLCGVADCRVNGRSYHREDRTQAAALSALIGDLAKTPELIGEKWSTESGLTGSVVKPRQKGARRVSISEHESFELLGGQMNVRK